MTDTLCRAVHDAGLALSLVRCDGVCRRICHDQHALAPEAAASVAASIACALLLATRLKGSGLLTWTVQGEGALATHRVDAMGLGLVRAMIPPATHERLAARGPGEPLLGPGRLQVTRQLEGSDQLYQSALAIDPGHEAIATVANDFLACSDQIPARILLRVADGLEEVVGLYLERLPCETRIPLPPAAGPLLAGTRDTLPDDADDAGLLRRLLADDGVKILRSYPVAFHCPCNRERYQATLRSFPREQILALGDGHGQVVARCDFCRTSHAFAIDDLLG